MRGVILAWLILLALSARGNGDEKSDKDEAARKRAADKAACLDECDGARQTLREANAACSSAKASCSNAIKEAKRSCINREETQTARDMAECSRTDPIPECYVGARAAGADRIAACGAAEYNPSDCGKVAYPCEQARLAEGEKAEACKC